MPRLNSWLAPFAVAICGSLSTASAVADVVVPPAVTAVVVDSAAECGDLFLVSRPSGYMVITWLSGYLPNIGDSLKGEFDRGNFIRVKELVKGRDSEVMEVDRRQAETDARNQFLRRREGCLPPAYFYPTTDSGPLRNPEWRSE